MICLSYEYRQVKPLIKNTSKASQCATLVIESHGKSNNESIYTKKY